MKSLSTLRLVLIVSALIFISFGAAACGKAPTSNESPLTRQDQAEIIRLTLERALIDQEIPDYGLIKDTQNIVLTLVNIDATLVPEMPGINLILLTREEIQAKADSEGDFLYLEFTEIKAESDTKVTISLDNMWAAAKDSEVAYLSGGGFTIEYTKTSAGWVAEMIVKWMS